MLRKPLILVALLLCWLVAPDGATAAGSAWSSSVRFANQVASTPFVGGGYPDPPGQTFPNPGTCGPGEFNSNHSESWITVEPGTENLVGSAKFFFAQYSEFYNFYVGAIQFPGALW